MLLKAEMNIHFQHSHKESDLDEECGFRFACRGNMNFIAVVKIISMSNIEE